MLLAGTDAGLAECLPRCGDAGCRQCADPSEDVRKPSLLCRQTDRHGSADHSLRSAQGDCDWVGNRFKLRGSNMVSPDIRAGIALLIAAMSAEGTSHIHNIDQIDRGYQNIDKRLNGIGARITRL